MTPLDRLIIASNAALLLLLAYVGWQVWRDRRHVGRLRSDRLDLYGEMKQQAWKNN